jgi:osmoprotectant transport system ATP-binding protein
VSGVVELVEVVKRYGDTTALGPLTLGVSEGETLALLGPSGAGKSTALRLMLGLAEPERGEVRFRGQRLAPADHARRRLMGYAVQGGGLFPHLSAAENVTLVARYLRLDRSATASRLRALSALVRLPEEALARYPAELSGGQAQRVSLMRALMLDPAVLLLDEPLGALDPVTRAQLQEDLRRIFRELEKTVVLVTHDLAEAAFFAHRIALLCDGQLAQEGTYQELRRSPAGPFVARFVGAGARRGEAGEEG